MTITVVPLTETFAAEVGDINLSEKIDPADLLAMKEALAKYAVLIFPDQHLSPDQHLDFARHFGNLDVSSEANSKDGPSRLREELTDLSNLDLADQIWGRESSRRSFQLGVRLWHTDFSFRWVPARMSLLYARSIAPIGGHTEFADERAAYDALPEQLKCGLESLVAEHSIFHLEAQLRKSELEAEKRRPFMAMPQAVVRTVSDSGRKSLYLSAYAGRIRGMPENQGRKLINDLIAHATQRQFVYTHRWRVHDLVMWDDRCTMHRGTEYNDLRWKRDLQRATVRDVGNSCLQEGLSPVAA